MAMGSAMHRKETDGNVETVLSEPGLAKDWLRPEEEAWLGC